MGKPEGKRPLGKERSSTEDNIKEDFHEFVFRVIEWIILSQDRGRLMR